MFAVKSRIDVFVRVVIIASVLFNALAPIPALAKPAEIPDAGSVDETISESARSMPDQTRLYFDPPMVEQPQRRSPDPDRANSRVPAKDLVEFTLVATPAIVPADGLITFKVHVRNNSGDPLQDLVFSDLLETGLEYRPDDASPVAFDARSKTVNFTIESLEANGELSFSYSVLVTSSRRSQTQGMIWLHGVELVSEQAGIQLSTSAAFGVGLAGANADTQLAPMQLNGGWSDLGRVSIHMERENVGRNAFVLASPVRIDGNGPALQFELDVYESGPLAADPRGRFDEQAVGLTREHEEPFQKPAYLEINLDEYMDLTHIPGGQEAYVATYDETHQIWVKVPILETDYESNSVTVEAAHFSTWGAGLGSSLPQNGANVLLFDQPYINHFLQPDTIIPNPESPQSWNRYSYTGNNPIRYSDPSGHIRVEGCTELAGGCDITQRTIDEDLKKAEEFRQTTNANKCKKGNKLYCSHAENHPVETTTFVVTALVGGPILEEFMFGGGAAPALEAGFWRVAQSCSMSAICRGITGMAGGSGLYGQKVFRIWGSDPNKPGVPGSSPWGPSWSPVDPRTVQNVRNPAGLPSGGASGSFNTGRFVSEGIITDASGITIRTALPLDGQTGGQLEYIITTAIEKIQLLNVSGVNPPY